MDEPFIGEIRVASFGFAPKGWAFCNGQLLPINQNQALFSILGTTYGGDGRVTFALPNLQGATPVHAGTGGSVTISLGERGGEENHTLSANEIPAHTHPLIASSDTGVANLQSDAVNAFPAKSGNPGYAPPSSADVQMSPQAIGSGGSQPHPNMQPYTTLNFMIALQGIFPSRN